MKENVAYMNLLRRTSTVLIIDLGRYLDKGKYKWFNTIKILNSGEGLPPRQPRLIGR